jgi:hypothetical protein
MRIVIIEASGLVSNVLAVPDTWTVAGDGSSVTGPNIATSDMEEGENAPSVGQMSSIEAPAGGLIVASDIADIGATYEAGEFTPPPPVPVPPKRQFSFLEFMDLFTDSEQLALAGAAMTDAATKLWYDRAVGAQFISLDDARLTAGLDAMVAAELLTAPRRDRVLQGLPPDV